MNRPQQTSISLLNGWTLPAHPPVHQPASDGQLVHLSWKSDLDTCYQLFQDGTAISPFTTTGPFTIPAIPYPTNPSDPTLLYVPAIALDSPAKASSTYSGTTAKNGIDRSMSTYWRANTIASSNPWLAVDLQLDVPIVSYKLHVAVPVSPLSNSNVLSGWRLQAAKAATPDTWVDIHTGNVPTNTATPWTFSLDGVETKYNTLPSSATFANPQAYRHWRILVTNTRSNSTPYISDWALFQKNPLFPDPLPVITIQPTGATSGLSNSAIPFPSLPGFAVSDTQISVSGHDLHRKFTLPYVSEDTFAASIESVTQTSAILTIDGLPIMAISSLSPSTDYTITVQIRRDSVVMLTRMFAIQTLPVSKVWLRERQLPKTFHQSQNAQKADFRVIRTIFPVPGSSIQRPHLEEGAEP